MNIYELTFDEALMLLKDNDTLMFRSNDEKLHYYLHISYDGDIGLCKYDRRLNERGIPEAYTKCRYHIYNGLTFAEACKQILSNEKSIAVPVNALMNYVDRECLPFTSLRVELNEHNERVIKCWGEEGELPKFLLNEKFIMVYNYE